MVPSETEIEARLAELRRRRDALDREIADHLLYLELGRRLRGAGPTNPPADPPAGPVGGRRETEDTAAREAAWQAAQTGLAGGPAQDHPIPIRPAAPQAPAAPAAAFPEARPDSVPAVPRPPRTWPTGPAHPVSVPPAWPAGDRAGGYPAPHGTPAAGEPRPPHGPAGPGPHAPAPSGAGLVPAAQAAPPPVAFEDDPAGARRYGRALVEAALAVLTEAGRPMHAGEILEHLVARGFTVPGQDPVAALNTRLWKRAAPGGPLRRLGDAIYDRADGPGSAASFGIF